MVWCAYALWHSGGTEAFVPRSIAHPCIGRGSFRFCSRETISSITSTTDAMPHINATILEQNFGVCNRIDYWNGTKSFQLIREQCAGHVYGSNNYLAASMTERALGYRWLIVDCLVNIFSCSSPYWRASSASDLDTSSHVGERNHSSFTSYARTWRDRDLLRIPS
jgi:hypothetical protein